MFAVKTRQRNAMENKNRRARGEKWNSPPLHQPWKQRGKVITWFLCVPHDICVLLSIHTYICSIVFSCHNKTDEITPLKVRVNPLHGPWKRPKLTETYYKGVRIDTTSWFYHNFTLHANNRGLNLFFSLSLYFPPEEHHHSGNKDTEHQC